VNGLENEFTQAYKSNFNDISLLLSTKSIRFVVLEILLLLENELFAYLKLKLGNYT